MTGMAGVIPAAGRGSRLGYTGPKALAPLGERRLIDYVLDAMVPQLTELVVVVSPAHHAQLLSYLRGLSLHVAFSVVIQPNPTGSANAVQLGLDAVSEPVAIVAWCDQVGLRQQTVEEVARRLLDNPGVAVAPLTEVEKPYVWVENDVFGRITRVGRARDGDNCPERGLSDLGLFGLPRGLKYRPPAAEDGREQDFVYQLPVLSQAGLLDTFVVAELNQTLAVNTGPDLLRAAQLLEGVTA